MNRLVQNKRRFAGATLAAAALATALAAGMAQAQQGTRYGLAPAVSAPPAPAPLPQPQILIRSHPVYLGSGWYGPVSAPKSSPHPASPYLTGPGQWVPEGAQDEALTLQWEPGYTRATAAAASGHWDWKRASMADLVALSRRNKASRAAD